MSTTRGVRRVRNVQLQSGICFRPFLHPNNESGSIDLLHTFCQTLLGPALGTDVETRKLNIENEFNGTAINVEFLFNVLKYNFDVNLGYKVTNEIDEDCSSITA